MFNCLEHLSASSRVIPFIGYDFDLGFIPLGQSVPILEGYQYLLQKNSHLSAADVLKKKISLIARFCHFCYPSVTQENILHECGISDLESFLNEIIESIYAELAQINRLHSKTKATKKKNSNFNELIDLFSLLFREKESYILRSYNLTSFYRKLENGLKYHNQLSGLASQENEEFDQGPKQLTKADLQKLNELYI